MSHALLCRRSYAECHTAQVVSRDARFPPCRAIARSCHSLARAFGTDAPVYISQGVNGLRLFGNHCLSFYRRTQLGEWLTHFHSRSLAYDYCGLGALANIVIEPTRSVCVLCRLSDNILCRVLCYLSRQFITDFHACNTRSLSTFEVTVPRIGQTNYSPSPSELRITLDQI
jgi:hypothetical protein